MSHIFGDDFTGYVAKISPKLENLEAKSKGKLLQKHTGLKFFAAARRYLIIYINFINFQMSNFQSLRWPEFGSAKRLIRIQNYKHF